MMVYQKTIDHKAYLTMAEKSQNAYAGFDDANYAF